MGNIGAYKLSEVPQGSSSDVPGLDGGQGSLRMGLIPLASVCISFLLAVAPTCV